MESEDYSVPEFTEEQKRSYGEILGEIGATSKDLLQSDLSMILGELNMAKERLSKHGKKFAIFGSLVVLSIFPLMAFAVIGLGRLLNNQFWLSSLIVGLAMAAIGGFGMSNAYERIKAIDLRFSRTRAALKREARVISNGLSKVEKALKGDLHATN